jgi:uncharacterized protein YggU (UPF0235/DUF167 family)
VRGLRLTVRLTPKSSRDVLETIERGADGRSFVKARVRAVPDNNCANTALLLLLARKLGVAKSGMSLVSGATGRLKVIEIVGDSHKIAGVCAQVFAAGSGAMGSNREA